MDKLRIKYDELMKKMAKGNISIEEFNKELDDAIDKYGDENTFDER